jgi:hypothetical protein
MWSWLKQWRGCYSCRRWSYQKRVWKMYNLKYVFMSWVILWKSFHFMCVDLIPNVYVCDKMGFFTPFLKIVLGHYRPLGTSAYRPLGHFRSLGGHFYSLRVTSIFHGVISDHYALFTAWQRVWPHLRKNKH